MKQSKLMLLVGLLVAGLVTSTSALAAKVYTVGSDAAYAPFESLNDKKEVIGFDVDVLQAIAAKSGIQLKFINTPWEGIFASLNAGDRDIVVSAVTITAERKQSMDFSDPYFEAKQLIAVRGNSKLTKFTDLKTKRVGVQKLQGKTSSNIKRFESTPLAISELLNDGVEAVVADNGVLVNYVANNPKAHLKTVDDATFAKEYYGIAVKKGNKELLEKINKGLAAIKADGTYDKIYKKYFGK